MTLDQCPAGTAGTIANADWAALGTSAARRLRAMGFEAGVLVTPIRQGGVTVVEIGRMTIALRATQAAAFTLA